MLSMLELLVLMFGLYNVTSSELLWSVLVFRDFGGILMLTVPTGEVVSDNETRHIRTLRPVVDVIRGQRI